MANSRHCQTRSFRKTEYTVPLTLETPRTMIMSFCVLFLLFTTVAAQVAPSGPVPIPPRPHGLTYYPAGHRDHLSPILLEAFIEVACIDAKNAFPVFLEVANSYEGKVKLVLYQFPLPYHRSAMLGAQTLRIVSEVEPEMVLCYLNTSFQNQEDIKDGNIVNKTETELISTFADFAGHCGVPRDVFYELYNEDFGKREARAEWKYGCSRGVSGTPFVYLNGIFLTNNQDWTVEDYKQVIDGLDAGQ